MKASSNSWTVWSPDSEGLYLVTKSLMSFKGDTMTWLDFPCDYYPYLSRNKITVSLKYLLSFSATVTCSRNNPHVYDKVSFIHRLTVFPKTSVLRMVSHTSVEPSEQMESFRLEETSGGAWASGQDQQWLRISIQAHFSYLQRITTSPSSLFDCMVGLLFLPFWCFACFLIVKSTGFVSSFLIRSYSLCISSSHCCEEPGPQAPDGNFAGMNGLQSDTLRLLFFRLKQPRLPQRPLPGLCSSLLTTLMVPLLALLPFHGLPGSRTKNQIQYSRKASSTKQRGIITSL